MNGKKSQDLAVLENTRKYTSDLIIKSRKDYYMNLGSKLNDPLLAKRSYWSIVKTLFMGLFGLLAQPAAKGALPQLYAATDKNAKAGAYYGPDGFNEFSGYPKLAKVPKSAQNMQAQEKLWKVSEELTKVSFLSD